MFTLLNIIIDAVQKVNDLAQLKNRTQGARDNTRTIVHFDTEMGEYKLLETWLKSRVKGNI